MSLAGVQITVHNRQRQVRVELAWLRKFAPLALAAVSVTFLLCGTLACLGPAWRATTVDPMIALRAD